MVLSQREKYIALGVLAALLLLVLDHFAFSPYFTETAAIAKAREDALRQQGDADTLFTRQRKLRTIWTELQNGGLKVDSSQAESQTLHALNEWTRASGVHLDSLKSERASQAGSFQVITFSVQGTGSLPQVSRLLWAVETATIPVRLNDMQITPRREGTDDLSVRISLSALCQPPEAPTKIASAAEFGGGPR